MGNGPILVVDDDAVSRHVLCQALSALGVPVIAADTGAHALAEMRKECPSLILLDVVMPDIDGYELLATIRGDAVLSEVPVIVLTAVDAEDEIARAFEAGADDFVRKPFRPVELLARVRGQQRLRGSIDQLAKRERDTQLVLELTQTLSSNLDFRGILFTVVQRIAEVVLVDRVSIVLVREEGDVGYVVAASDDEQLRDLPIDLSGYPEIRRAVETGEPVIIRDATDARQPSERPLQVGSYSATMRSPAVSAPPALSSPPSSKAGDPASEPIPFRSAAILPIVYEGRATGVLFLRSHAVDSFGHRETALCRIVASAMAIALRNARVLQSLREQTQQVTVARFEAERKLRSLQRYADFFESSADGIIVLDLDGHVLFSNPKAHEISGHDGKALQGLGFHRLFSISAEDVTQLFEGFSRGEFPEGADFGLTRPSGETRIVNTSFTSVLREEGAILCSFRDVTQERAMEAELIKTKDSLQRVIDSSFDAIVSADMSGTVTIFSRAAERIFGRPASSVVGTSVRLLYPPGQAEHIMRQIRSGGGRIEELQSEVLDANGRTVPVSFSGALVHDGGRVIGSVGIFTDLREKKRMEQQLQQAQEQIIAQERQAIIAELAGTAAHELNQPLQVVLAYAQLMQRKLSGESPVREAVDVVATEVQRMADIVRKIGRITKYETKDYMGTQRILDLDRASPESDAKVPSSKQLGRP
ncbi:MAG: PAS domain S-box protein [Polyangiaceae bacterium]